MFVCYMLICFQKELRSHCEETHFKSTITSSLLFKIGINHEILRKSL